jgi:hypothetical protein
MENITIILTTLAASNGVGIHHYAKTVAEMESEVMICWLLFLHSVLRIVLRDTSCSN